MRSQRTHHRRPAAFRRLLASVLVASASASCVSAQSTAAFDPFRPLSGEATCEIVASPSREPVSSKRVFSFAEGEEMRDQRLIEVGYDSLGRPLWAAVHADEFLGTGSPDGASTRGWRVIPHGYSIRFDRASGGEGLHIPGIVPGDPTVPAGRGRSMNAEELRRARHLFELLWRRGCGRVLGT